MKVGVGIATFDRPDYLRQCLEGIKNLTGAVDSIWVYNDGSNRKDYEDVYKETKAQIKHAKENKGVAKAKNWLLKKLMDEGCDYIFLLEDDIVIKSPKAVTEYIKMSEVSGIEHFMFAHHGPVGTEKFAGTVNGIDFFSGCVGAWCMYTRRVINTVGYFDENFINAWEHIEHTKRIADAGLTTRWGIFPDVHGSKKWLEEIPGSIDSSSIKPRADWMANTINGLIYWRNKDKRFPLNHILESLLKEEAEEYKKLGIENPRYV